MKYLILCFKFDTEGPHKNMLLQKKPDAMPISTNIQPKIKHRLYINFSIGLQIGRLSRKEKPIQMLKIV